MLRLPIIILLLLSLSWSASAQTDEGSKFIGGNFRISFLSGNDVTITSLSLSPQMGFFTKDNQAWGGQLILGASFTEGGGTTALGIAPFVRRYIPIVEEKFFFTAELRLTFSYGTTLSVDNITFTTNDEALSVVASLSPGFAYFPAEQWSINFVLDGVSLGLYGIGERTLFGLSIGTGLTSPSIGLNYYF